MRYEFKYIYLLFGHKHTPEHKILIYIRQFNHFECAVHAVCGWLGWHTMKLVWIFLVSNTLTHAHLNIKMRSSFTLSYRIV